MKRELYGDEKCIEEGWDDERGYLDIGLYDKSKNNIHGEKNTHYLDSLKLVLKKLFYGEKVEKLSFIINTCSYVRNEETGDVFDTYFNHFILSKGFRNNNKVTIRLYDPFISRSQIAWRVNVINGILQEIINEDENLKDLVVL